MGTDVVGLGDLLEEGVGLRRGVLVGVVLHGEAAVGLLELVVGGAAADAQHLVVVHPHRAATGVAGGGRCSFCCSRAPDEVLDFGWYR